jgi:hypothetical protein
MSKLNMSVQGHVGDRAERTAGGDRTEPDTLLNNKRCFQSKLMSKLDTSVQGRVGDRCDDRATLVLGSSILS